MSKSVSNVEIEDVLSSIRRLVSTDNRTARRPGSEKTVPEQEPADRLILTPSQRVSEFDDAYVMEDETDADVIDDGSDAFGDGYDALDDETAAQDDAEEMEARSSASIFDDGDLDEADEEGLTADYAEDVPEEEALDDEAPFAEVDSDDDDPEPASVSATIARFAGLRVSPAALDDVEDTDEIEDSAETEAVDLSFDEDTVAEEGAEAARAEPVVAEDDLEEDDPLAAGPATEDRAGGAAQAPAGSPLAEELRARIAELEALLRGQTEAAHSHDAASGSDDLEVTADYENSEGDSDVSEGDGWSSLLVARADHRDPDPDGGSDTAEADEDSNRTVDPAADEETAAVEPEEALEPEQEDEAAEEPEALSVDEAEADDEPLVGEETEAQEAVLDDNDSDDVVEDESDEADRATADDMVFRSAGLLPGSDEEAERGEAETDAFDPDDADPDAMETETQSLTDAVQQALASDGAGEEHAEAAADSDDEAPEDEPAVEPTFHSSRHAAVDAPMRLEEPVATDESVTAEESVATEEPVVAEAEVETVQAAVESSVLGALGLDEAVIDEDTLRDMVAEIVRVELQGALGERITRNVRKLVRREIHRALISRDFD